MHARTVLVLACLCVSGEAGAIKRPEKAPGVELVVRALGVELDPSVSLDARERAIAHRAGSRLVSLCPDCRLGTIDEEGPCGWARTQRTVIRNAVKRGLTEEEIVETYVETYGPDILAITEDSPIAVMSWSVPYALISFGLALVVVIALRLRRREPKPPPNGIASEDDRQALHRALEDLD